MPTDLTPATASWIPETDGAKVPFYDVDLPPTEIGITIKNRFPETHKSDVPGPAHYHPKGFENKIGPKYGSPSATGKSPKGSITVERPFVSVSRRRPGILSNQGKNNQDPENVEPFSNEEYENRRELPISTENHVSVSVTSSEFPQHLTPLELVYPGCPPVEISLDDELPTTDIDFSGDSGSNYLKRETNEGFQKDNGTHAQRHPNSIYQTHEKKSEIILHSGNENDHADNAASLQFVQGRYPTPTPSPTSGCGPIWYTVPENKSPFKWLTKGRLSLIGVICATVAFLFGILHLCFWTNATCIFTGTWLVLWGLPVIITEGVNLDRITFSNQLTFLLPLTKFVNSKPPWVKTAVYAMLGIVALAVCAKWTSGVAGAFLVILSIFYGFKQIDRNFEEQQAASIARQGESRVPISHIL